MTRLAPSWANTSLMPAPIPLAPPVMIAVFPRTRHEPQKIDMEFIEWLGENGIPFSIVFTKADKSKPTKLKANIDAYLKALKEQWEELPPYFITSSENKTGRTELLNYIESINKSL